MKSDYNFIHTSVQYTCNILKSKCYDVHEIEQILDYNKSNGELLLSSVTCLNNALSNRLAEQLKRIVWKLVLCLYVKNSKLRHMSQHRGTDGNDLVAATHNKMFSKTTDTECASDLINYLKKLYEKHYLHEMIGETCDWNELTEILITMNRLMCVM
ncbi:orf99 [Sucra jujuba nucleopolyhedrovirus]|uniref:Orf99 n=1 Tax=Sucra jujuba nucleopolyhedrovirus TaxID=1563660 RepID=A0A097P942_9ABAC|nr:orf99 [Sucra jujuba nucleopolyhedrovirus]AIU41338.1 orf99 [Sucra jujuba nucleopolyhedrovirus]